MSKKAKQFYYLLPGQGRGARKRWIRNIVVAFIVGSITAFLIGWIIYKIES